MLIDFERHAECLHRANHEWIDHFKYFLMRTISSKLLLAFAALALAQAVRANLVLNGGFEDALRDWTSVGAGGPGDFDNSDPHSGNFEWVQSASFNLGGISQTIATVAGQSYTLDFWLGNQGDPGDEFEALWNGENAITPIVNADSFDYTEFTTTVVATGTSSTLTFEAYQDTGFFFMDDVSLTPASSGVPDSGSTVAILGMGLMGVAGFRRRFARRT